MKEDKIFTKSSVMDIAAADLFDWHAGIGAIERLSPPWDPVRVVESTGEITVGNKVFLKVTAGPFTCNWFAEHTDYIKHKMFKDEQLSGPFSKWIHTHNVKPLGEKKCILEDKIEFRLPFYLPGAVFNRFIIKKLEKVFAYRHRITREEIKIHKKYSNKPGLNILISGASGLIGSALIPFLTTGGHHVTRLVRDKNLTDRDSRFWDPLQGVLELRKTDYFDAVIHLAGENIGNSRWTVGKKKIITDSRIKSTKLIAKTISMLKKKPDIFIVASATGFYGDRGGISLTEDDKAGNGFLSALCANWENAASDAVMGQIRTVFMRIGVVLTPEGGALKRLLLPVKLGAGGKFSSGRQYMSWISIDDVIGSIHHILMNDNIYGPVNLVSPNPVKNETFIKVLGKIFMRPTFLSLPAWVINLLFGEMGREILLSSTKVIPKKLVESGYKFRYPDLEKTFNHLLGRDI
ncbi:MAG TPA: TIGR01777 family protein [Desulfobacteraceae bacterium]|nr:TIGR01777 family protein [Desulfobacteraceae bacterium]